MKQKKLIAVLFCLLSFLSFCACGQNSQNTRDETGFSVSLQSPIGTGFYWGCTLSEEGIVSVESLQEIADDPVPGSSVTTTFRFSGLKYGTATADFACRQSWDDSVCYLYSCELTVDRDKTVTGELSRQTAQIHPGSGRYKLTASDTSIALWIDSEDGVFTFTPLRDGSTTLTFTPLDQAEAPSRVFYLTVDEAGGISISKGSEPEGPETYETMAQLEQSVGISMPLPEGAEADEICSVGSIAYANFVWNGMPFAYAGGALDLDDFLSPDANTVEISGNRVIIRNGLFTLAAWEKRGSVYCISTETILHENELLTLLWEILG